MVHREEERIRAEEEEAARKRHVLDLVNDPVLKRCNEKNHSVPKYARAPDSRPLAVCFDYLGPSVAHSTVKIKLDELIDSLSDSDDVKVMVVRNRRRRGC